MLYSSINMNPVAVSLLSRFSLRGCSQPSSTTVSPPTPARVRGCPTPVPTWFPPAPARPGRRPTSPSRRPRPSRSRRRPSSTSRSTTSTRWRPGRRGSHRWTCSGAGRTDSRKRCAKERANDTADDLFSRPLQVASELVQPKVAEKRNQRFRRFLVEEEDEDEDESKQEEDEIEKFAEMSIK